MHLSAFQIKMEIGAIPDDWIFMIVNPAVSHLKGIVIQGCFSVMSTTDFINQTLL